jgi:hypothetical protein
LLGSISSTFYKAFCANILAPKITKLCFGFEIFWRQNIDEKNVRKMLMKLTPGVNFTIVLSAAFTLVDPKSVKNTFKS